MEKEQLICPNCHQPIKEIEDHFSGCDRYKLKDNLFVKNPKDTIETYNIVHTPCGKALPPDVANKVMYMMVNNGV